MIDRLAEKAGISGWEMRSRNVVMPGSLWGPGQILDDGCLGARQCLDAVKPAYDAARDAGKAIGLGLGLKNSGLGNGFKEIAGAVVRIEEDGTSRCVTAGRRWARASTRLPCRWPLRNSA